MRLTDATAEQIRSLTFRAITPAGEFHIFKNRSEKRRWQRENGIVGAMNPLYRAQGRATEDAR